MKYRAVIADDESKVRLAVKMLADWDKWGLCLVGEYEDGDSLCSHLSGDCPDIIITDMKMPGIHGAELIAKLGNLNPDAEIIVISGFDDFKFVRQALRYHAVDYLLKPIMEEDLNQALEKAIKNLDGKQKRRQREELSRGLVYQINDFVYDGEAEEDFLLYMNWTAGARECCRAVYMNVYMNMEDNLSSGSLLHELETFAEKMLGDKGRFFLDLREGRGCFLLTRNMSGTELETLADQMISMGEQHGFDILAGIGCEYLDYESLPNSFMEAKIAAMDIDIKECRKIKYYETIRYMQGDEIDFTQAEFLLNAAVNSRNRIQIRKSVERIYSMVQQSQLFRMKSLTKLNKLVLEKIEELIKNQDIDCEERSKFRILERELRQTLDVNLVRLKINMFLEGLSDRDMSGKNGIGKTEMVKQYLDEHYMEKISLEALSGLFYLNKEYLSKLFKQEYSVGIFDYVDFLRIEKAKKLLIETNKSIGEITEELGFYDESHFNRKFRKMTGTAPREYKF